MILIYVALAVFLFGILIAVHEFGHFITAKMSGVKVNEFAIGMGPAIFKKKGKETLYALRILPFGGYCAMEGEDSGSDDPRAFSVQPAHKRILIVVAGSLMNLIAGFLVLLIVFAPVREWYIPTVQNVEYHTEYNENMIAPGDVIRDINGYRIYLFGDITTAVMRGSDDGKYDITVIRNGEEKTLTNVSLASGETTEVPGGKMGATIEFATEKSTFLGKAKYTFLNGTNLVRLVFVGLSDLISGGVSTDDVSGPIGIGKVMADTAKVSLASLWYLLAFISINLGIMNLLPLPALDGGRLFFILIELILRKPIPAKYEGYVHVAGFIILMLFMLFVTYNDIVKIFFK